MKFFLDTANLDEIRRAAALGLCDGVTTNPTLVVYLKLVGVDGTLSVDAVEALQTPCPSSS